MAQIEESVARYLEQLDTADRQEPSEALQTKTNRLEEKIETLKQQMRRLERLKVEMLAAPDQQISLTDPDARSMATSGRGSSVVGYNVQIAVEANHHLIVMHEVTNDGTDRSQLSPSWPTRPRRRWAWRSSMPSPTAVTSTARRFGHARRLVSRLRCQSR